MSQISMNRWMFENVAEGADLEIREDYPGRYGADNSLGLVGSESAFRTFLVELAFEVGEEDGPKKEDVRKLARSVAVDNMGRDLIFYWAPYILTLED